MDKNIETEVARLLASDELFEKAHDAWCEEHRSMSFLQYYEMYVRRYVEQHMQKQNKQSK